ncbi:MAG TPA: TVP38/TMEM64 family protein [Gemmatimonadaceae bacterium]|nr:TVP38/TMEM64 family protein [Gemmatimonadaceae bacterium]
MNNRRALAVAVVIAAAGFAWHIRGAAVFSPSHWLAFVRTHPLSSPIVFVPIYATAMICFVPTLPLNLVAGALWGPVLGSVLALVGSASGAVLAFVLARVAFGQPLANRFDQKLISRLQQEFTDHGWRVMAFVRLNPLFPGSVNFVFGLTSLPLWTFVWSTTVFLIPLTVVFSVLGSSVGGLLLDNSVANVRNTMLVSGASIAFLAFCAFWLRDRNSVRKKQEL